MTQVDGPMRYDITTDTLVPVTQAWVDGVLRMFRDLGYARRAAARAIAVEDGIVVTSHPALREFLASWQPEYDNYRAPRPPLTDPGAEGRNKAHSWGLDGQAMVPGEGDSSDD